MDNRNNIPVIRFKGFTEDWRLSTLSELVDIIDGDRGHNYPSLNEFIKQGHTLFLSASNVTKEGFRFSSKQYISLDKSKKLGNGKLETNDIILTSRGSVGHVAWYSKIVCKIHPFARINSGMLILRAQQHVAPIYISHFLKSTFGRKQIGKITFGSAQPQLTKKEVEKFKITLPESKTEQKQIGTFFQNLDNLITLHQKKYDKLVILKKAMLVKIFPKNGALVPEIRFKGCSGDWEVESLGKIAKITTGKSNREDSSLEGEYTFFDRSEEIRKSDIYLFDCEAIIIAGEGSDFIPKYFNGKFDLHQRTYAIINSKDIDGRFLQYQIHLFRKYFLDQAVGSTVKSLRLPMFLNMPIKFPSKTEQQKIGKYFENFDNQIALHKTQLDKLNTIKKACFSKMFVGQD